jgi:myogenesis-regulating glycosidase
MIKELNELGFRTTLWQHPFSNVDSATFLDKAFEFFWVRAPDELHPAFTAWWDGPAAGILDTTYPNASAWFLSELVKMKETYGIDSFKFDAGTVVLILFYK